LICVNVGDAPVSAFRSATAASWNAAACAAGGGTTVRANAAMLAAAGSIYFGNSPAEAAVSSWSKGRAVASHAIKRRRPAEGDIRGRIPSRDQQYLHSVNIATIRLREQNCTFLLRRNIGANAIFAVSV
jgi:hypothetical protein